MWIPNERKIFKLLNPENIEHGILPHPRQGVVRHDPLTHVRPCNVHAYFRPSFEFSIRNYFFKITLIRTSLFMGSDIEITASL